MSNPRSRRKTPSSPVSRARRSCGRAWFSAPEDVLFNPPRQDRFDGTVHAGGRQRPRQGPAGVRGRTSRPRRWWRCLARPDTAKSVFELGLARASTPLASWPHSPCARSTATRPIIGVPAGLMKLAAFFAEFPRHARPHPANQPATRSTFCCTTMSCGRAPRTSRPWASRRRRPRSSCPTYLDRFRVGGRYTTARPRPEVLRRRQPLTAAAFHRSPRLEALSARVITGERDSERDVRIPNGASP